MSTQRERKRKSAIKKEGEIETAIQRILSRLEDVQSESQGKSWMARCPAHDDSTPSLHVTVDDQGDVLLYCHGGCDTKDVLKALGLGWPDLFSRNGNGGGRAYPSESRAPMQPPEESGEQSMPLEVEVSLRPNTTVEASPEGCTLAQYAEAKRLPVDFLRELGLRDSRFSGHSAVRIPYFDREGNVSAIRFRTALEGKDRFRWERGAKLSLYGLWWFDDFSAFDYVVLVEGESDCHTLWLHGFPAVGLPSARSWKEDWAEHLKSFETIYVVIEPDNGGEAVRKWLAVSGFRARARLVDLGEAKDPSALYLVDPKHFRAHFQAAIEAAIPWTVTTGQSQPTMRGGGMTNRSAPIDVGSTTPHPEPPAIARLQRTVEEHFPALWRAVDLGLSVAATLLLEKNVNPVALVYVGKPSSGKTTVLTMFAGHPVTYLSDKFTPAAFVSSAANVSREDLEKIDLLPKIQHKVLITPELAPTFRGKEDELTDRFNTLIRVLDGQGLSVDSGTQGGRGYTGDYLFAWLGGTTPLDDKVWRIMAQLGSRLFFLVLGDGEEVTEEDLIADAERQPYADRLAECKHLVHEVLSDLFGAQSRNQVRSIPHQVHDLEVRRWLARLARLLAKARGCRSGTDEPSEENPRRIFAVLSNLAYGHAIVHGQEKVTMVDLPAIVKVTVSSMPTLFGRVFRALVNAKELTTAQVGAALGKRHHDTAKTWMQETAETGICEFIGGKGSKSAFLRFAKGWEWCNSPEFKGLL